MIVWDLPPERNLKQISAYRFSKVYTDSSSAVTYGHKLDDHHRNKLWMYRLHNDPALTTDCVGVAL